MSEKSLNRSRKCVHDSACECGLPVLIISASTVVRPSLEKKISGWGYLVSIVDIRDANVDMLSTVFREANQVLVQKVCVIVIVSAEGQAFVDNTSMMSDGLLDLVRDLPRATKRVVVTNSLEPGPNRILTDRFGVLTFLDTDEELKALEKYLQIERGKFCPKGVVFVPELETVLGSSEHIEEVGKLLAVLFPDAQDITVAQLPHATSLSSHGTTWNHQRSLKLIVRPDVRQPFVVKIGTRPKIDNELRNYREFVNAQILYYPILAPESDEAYLWNLGAIAYGVVGGDLTNITNFGEFYRNHDASDVREVLNRYFTELWNHNYKSKIRARALIPIDAYNQFHAQTLEHYPFDTKLLQKWNELVSDSWWNLEDAKPFLNLNPYLPDPRQWISRFSRRAGPLSPWNAIVHGDLHLDNLLVDSRSTPWVIDFEKTGEGYITLDFAELEQNILTRLIDVDSIELLYELMIAMFHVGRSTSSRLSERLVLPNTANKNETTAKAFDVLCYLHQIIAEISTAGEEYDFADFYWMLLLDSMHM